MLLHAWPTLIAAMLAPCSGGLATEAHVELGSALDASPRHVRRAPLVRRNTEEVQHAPAASEVSNVDPYAMYDGHAVLEALVCDGEATSTAHRARSARSAEEVQWDACVHLRTSHQWQGDRRCVLRLVACSPAAAASIRVSMSNASARGATTPRFILDDLGAHARGSDGVVRGRGAPAQTPCGAAVDTCGVPAETWFKNWTTYECMMARLDCLDQTVSTIGKSVEGEEIRAATFTGKGYQSGGTRLVIGCQQHAREWIAGMACLYVVEMIVKSVAAEPGTIDNVQIVVAPILNPDGVKYSHTKDRMWRKNRRPHHADPAGRHCTGVDLNRNFPPQNQSKDQNVCATDYPGPVESSEPETQAFMSLFHKAPTTMHLDIHSFSKLLIRPFACNSSAPPRRKETDEVGKLILRELNGGCKNCTDESDSYMYGGMEMLYPACGTASDYSVANGAIVLTLELPPGKAAGARGFAPGPEIILPTAISVWRSVNATTAWLRQEARRTATLAHLANGRLGKSTHVAQGSSPPQKEGRASRRKGT